MRTFTFDNIEVLRIEISTVCNAKCGGCARNNLKNFAHMNSDIWTKVIEEKNLKKIKRLYFNGNYGDFICHPASLNFLQQIPKKDLEIVISTNGSIHTSQYWKNLSEILQEFKNHLVTFAIDGNTNDIHSLHRRNTNLDTVLNNAQHFISYGGIAAWQFITFDKNIHQIDECYNKAKKLGFKKFTVLNSYKEKILTGKNIELNALPAQLYLKNSLRYQYSNISLENISDGNNTNCPWTKLKRIQINCDGTVWPCCWIEDNNIIYQKNIPTLAEHSLQEIIDSEYYQNYFTNLVNNNKSVCNMSCPAKYNDIRYVYKIGAN